MGVEIPAGLTQKQDYEAGGDVEKKKKKNLASGLGHTQVCSQLCHLLAVWPPGGSFTSLSSALTAASTAGVVGRMK